MIRAKMCSVGAFLVASAPLSRKRYEALQRRARERLRRFRPSEGGGGTTFCTCPTGFQSPEWRDEQPR